MLKQIYSRNNVLARNEIYILIHLRGLIFFE